MTDLLAYRDDGPLARWTGRTLGRAIPADAVVLIVVGSAPLLVALAVASRSGATSAAILGVLAFVACAGAGSGRRPGRALGWLAPPLLRATEYGLLIALTRIADPDALPACFALLVVLAFHHYDTVYRLRHQRALPAPWVQKIGGGWDGRLLVASLLAALDGLNLGLLIGAFGLAVVFAGESASSWMDAGRAEHPAGYDDEDEALE